MESQTNDLAVIDRSRFEAEVQETGIGAAIERLNKAWSDFKTAPSDDGLNALSVAGSDLATKRKQVQGMREREYKPRYDAVVNLREVYDTPLKLAKYLEEGAGKSI